MWKSNNNKFASMAGFILVILADEKNTNALESIWNKLNDVTHDGFLFHWALEDCVPQYLIVSCRPAGLLDICLR